MAPCQCCDSAPSSVFPSFLGLGLSHVPWVFFLCSLLTILALCTPGNRHNAPGTSPVPFGRIKHLWGDFGAFPVTISPHALTSTPLRGLTSFCIPESHLGWVGGPALQDFVVSLGDFSDSSFIRHISVPLAELCSLAKVIWEPDRVSHGITACFGMGAVLNLIQFHPLPHPCERSRPG